MTAHVALPLPVDHSPAMWWPADLVLALHRTLRQRLPDDVARTLYRLGRFTGARLAREHACDPDDAPLTGANTGSMSRRLQVWDEWFANAGWGRFDAIPLGPATVINHYDSPIAMALRMDGPADSPVDDFFAGLFAELLTQQTGQTQESVEISCLTSHAHYCCFVVGEAGIVRKVYAWLTYHLAPHDILKRLADETAQ
jgi:predicted hydrocarbon binding protein